MNFLRHIMAISTIGLANISCATTADVTSNRSPAILLNVDKAELREAIRIFVRKDAGHFVIADPDAFSISPDMMARRRATDFQLRSRSLPAANLHYRLLSDGKNCWLVRHETDLESPIAVEILLPESARCAPYRN